MHRLRQTLNAAFDWCWYLVLRGSLALEGRQAAGQGLVEYGLIVALIAVAALTTARTFGNDIKTMISGLGSAISSIPISGG
jgi:Flp pilus assembly pilin Flp